MFRINQILSATTFLPLLGKAAQRLASTPDPLFITQRDGRFIVIMDGEFFEGIMGARHELQGLRDAPENSRLCDLKS